MYVQGELRVEPLIWLSWLSSASFPLFKAGVWFLLLSLLWAPFKTAIYLWTKCIASVRLTQLIQPDLLKAALPNTMKNKTYLENSDSFEIVNLLKFRLLILRPNYTLFLKHGWSFILLDLFSCHFDSLEVLEPERSNLLDPCTHIHPIPYNHHVTKLAFSVPWPKDLS